MIKIKKAKVRYSFDDSLRESIVITNEREFWAVYEKYGINCVPKTVLEYLKEGKTIIVNSKGGWCTDGGGVKIEGETY